MSRSKVNVRESEAALEKMKFEVASELGVNLKQGYNGNLSSRDNGYVGGYMVKKMYPVQITKNQATEGDGRSYPLGEIDIERLNGFGHPDKVVYSYAISME